MGFFLPCLFFSITKQKNEFKESANNEVQGMIISYGVSCPGRIGQENCEISNVNFLQNNALHGCQMSIVRTSGVIKLKTAALSMNVCLYYNVDSEMFIFTAEI